MSPFRWPTDRNRWLLERVLFLFPPVVGVGLISVIRQTGSGIALLDRTLLLVSTTGYTLLTAATTAIVVVDAWRFRSRGATKRHNPEWRPNPLLYGLGAVLWAPVVGILYLNRRHRHVGTPAGWDGWWLVIALSLCVTVISIGGAVIAVALVMPTLLVTVLGLAGTIAFGVFPMAIYQDAAYVSAQTTDATPRTDHQPWNPTPSTYLGLAFCTLFLPLLQPLLAAYYLGRRQGTIGLA